MIFLGRGIDARVGLLALGASAVAACNAITGVGNLQFGTSTGSGGETAAATSTSTGTAGGGSATTSTTSGSSTASSTSATSSTSASTTTSSSSSSSSSGTPMLPTCGAPQKVATPSLTYPVGISVVSGAVWLVDPAQGQLVKASDGTGVSTANKCTMSPDMGLFGGYVGPWEVAATKDVVFWTNSVSGEVDQWKYTTAMPYSAVNGTATSSCSGNTYVSAWGIAADPDTNDVYWTAVTDTGGKRTLQIQKAAYGSSPTTLYSADGVSYSLALDGPNVYFANYDTGEIRKVPKSGGSSVLLATDDATKATGIAAGHGYVYWGNGTQLRRVSENRVCTPPCDAGTAVSANTETGVWRVAVGANGVYWIVTNDGKSAGQIKMANFDGSGETLLATAQGGSPFIVRLDGNDVYWSETQPGSVQHVHCSTPP